MRWPRFRQPAATWSLSSRLAWRLAGVMLAAILLTVVTVVWHTVQTLHDLDDTALQSQIETVADNLPEPRSGRGPLTLPAHVVAFFRSSDGDNLFIVLGQDHELRATSDQTSAVQAMRYLPAPLRPGLFRIAMLPGHPHGMVGSVQPAGQDWVIVLQGREQTRVLVNSLITHFMAGTIWALGPISLLTILVSIATLRRGLAPVRRAAAAAAAVGPAHPGLRLPEAGLPAEVSPFVSAVNQALTRLEHTIAVQRSFMAQAAHGLRTPLAVLTARLDSMADTEAVKALRHDADRMSRLVSQMLRMGRLESLPMELDATVDLHAVAAEAISDLAPLGLRRGVALALTGDAPVLRRGNAAALLLAVTNLLENAIGYAPPQSSVEVVVTAPGSIAVLDRGPGIAPAHQARILLPFERGPDAREGGAGLGLAIVAEIARAHGGRLLVAERAGGGAAFSLLLADVGE